ncbi:MAG: hypothetical protein V2B18_25375 [Pseudomonadota bacterium]
MAKDESQPWLEDPILDTEKPESVVSVEDAPWLKDPLYVLPPVGPHEQPEGLDTFAPLSYYRRAKADEKIGPWVEQQYEQTGMDRIALMQAYRRVNADPPAWGVATAEEAQQLVATKAELEGKRTLGEEFTEDLLLDTLSILPFSPLHDWEKKGYRVAQRRLEAGQYGAAYGMTPMGGYMMIQAPATREELKAVVRDYELEQARGLTIPAAVGKGAALLPGFIGEFAAGGAMMKSLGLAGTLPAQAGTVKKLAHVVGNALTRAGLTTAIQPHRVTSALIDQEMAGETGMPAVAKAYGAVYIEDLTELTGEAFNVVGAKIIGQLPLGGKLFNRIQREAVRLGLDEAGFFGRITRKGGWNGLLSEIGEERLNTIMYGIFSIDDFGAGPDSTIRQRVMAGLKQDMQAENMLVEGLILSTPGGVKIVARQAARLYAEGPELQAAVEILEQAVEADQQVQVAEQGAEGGAEEAKPAEAVSAVPTEAPAAGAAAPEAAPAPEVPAITPTAKEGSVSSPLTVYHGARTDVKGRLRPDANGLVWVTRDPQWAKGYGGNILEFQLPADKILRIDAPENAAILEQYLREHPEGRSKAAEMQFAEKLGYVAVERGREIAVRPESLSPAPPVPDTAVPVAGEEVIRELPKEFEQSAVREELYHGSPAGNIETFFTEQGQTGDNTRAKNTALGAYFSENSVIAGLAAFGFSPMGAFTDKPLTLYTVRVNLRNPLNLDALNDQQMAELEESFPGFRKAYDKAGDDKMGLLKFLAERRRTQIPQTNFATWARNRGIAESEINRLFETKNKEYQEWQTEQEDVLKRNLKSEGKDRLKSLGYDGIVLNTWADSGEKIGKQKQYVVFDPENIAIVNKRRLAESAPAAEEAVTPAAKENGPDTALGEMNLAYFSKRDYAERLETAKGDQEKINAILAEARLESAQKDQRDAEHEQRLKRIEDAMTPVRDRIRAAPSFGNLRARTIAFWKSLYGREPDRITRSTGEYDAEPERYLSAHAGVMKAESARAKTLHELAKKVIQEAGVPVLGKEGKFRGEAQVIDYDKLLAQFAPAPRGPKAAQIVAARQGGRPLTDAIEKKDFDILRESLLPGNDVARAQFEDETGIELPQSLAGTENTVGEFVLDRLKPPPSEPRLAGGPQAGGTTIIPDVAVEAAGIARTLTNNPVRLVSAVWESLKRNYPPATAYLRTLGRAGALTANELDDIQYEVTRKHNTDMADLREIHRRVSKSQRELLYQAMNERIPLDKLPDWLQQRVVAVRELLDRAMKQAASLGMERKLASGERVIVGGKGQAYPQVPNAEGLRFLEEAYVQGKGSSRVFAWAQDQVKAGRFENVDQAIKELVRFRDTRFRGVNAYLERSRVELPVEMVEWDGARTLSTVIERNWMTVEGVRKWGVDFQKLYGRLERMREEHGADAAQRVKTFIQISFGIQSPAGREAQTISNLIRAFQFITKISLSPLTIVRNMIDRLAKGMMDSPLATIQTFIEYPPFINALLPHARRLEDQMIRNGVVFGHGTISEGYEAGSFFADLAKSPFTASERGNQVFIAAVNYKKLMHDIAILEREYPGSLGRIEKAVRTVFGQAPAQAAERVGPDIAAKVAAGAEVKQEDIYRFLHEMVRDRAFPMILTTKSIWYDAHPMMKILAQFKTWPMRQTDMIWRDVVKYTIHTGDMTRLIGFLLGTLIAGELYNILRDLIYGRKESIALAEDTPKAVLRDLADGGFWGIAADLTYGIWDWAGGVSLKTGKNVVETAHHIWKAPGLAPEALDRLLTKEVAPYRQVKELARRVDSGDMSEAYGQWRAKAYEWKETQEAPGPFAKAAHYTEDIVFGRPTHEIGENTLALELASRRIVTGDIDGAAEYLAYVLNRADDRDSALAGIKSSRTRRSPLGAIPEKDQMAFLKSLGPEERRAVRQLQRKYIQMYDRAILQTRKLKERR